jgi:hypothetical protein
MLCLMNDTLTTYNSGHLSPTNTGLGNVLFQIAVAYGLAKKCDRKLYFNHVHSFSEKLQGDFGLNHGKTIFRKCQEKSPLPESEFVSVGENISLFRAFDKSLLESIQSMNTHVRISGHFECVEYFKEYRNEILDLFSIDSTSELYIQTKYPQLFDTSSTPISVHFRVVNWDYMIDVDFYIQALNVLLSLAKHPVLFIFSDDIDYTKQNYISKIHFLQTIPIIYVSENPDYIDLWCMSLCKYNVLCHSTFSFWGAYLNKTPGKLAVANKHGATFLNYLENIYTN